MFLLPSAQATPYMSDLTRSKAALSAVIVSLVALDPANVASAFPLHRAMLCCFAGGRKRDWLASRGNNTAHSSGDDFPSDGIPRRHSHTEQKVQN